MKKTLFVLFVYFFEKRALGAHTCSLDLLALFLENVNKLMPSSEIFLQKNFKTFCSESEVSVEIEGLEFTIKLSRITFTFLSSPTGIT